MKKNLNKDYKKSGKCITYITGTIDHVHATYAYFIASELQQDIRIATKNMLDAWDKDTVKVAIKIDKKGEKKAKVVEILQRHYKQIVVCLQKKDEKILAIPSQRIYHKHMD